MNNWLIIALLTFITHNKQVLAQHSLCDNPIEIAEEGIILKHYTIPPLSSLAFSLNSTRHPNSMLSVKVYSDYGSPSLGIYASVAPMCPSPPTYPGYSACCSRTEENQLPTHNQYNIIIQPVQTSKVPVTFKLRVCGDGLNCAEICPGDCSNNGWCNTTSKTCACDNGYVGDNCAECPGCSNTGSGGGSGDMTPKLYMGIFTTVGMAVLVVGIIPIVTIVAIISTIVFLRRQASEQRYLKLPVHTMYRNKGLGLSKGDEEDPDSDEESEGGSEAGAGTVIGVVTAAGAGTVGSVNGEPVLYRTAGNAVMYSPSASLPPKKYTAVPMQTGPNGTQIFQLDE